MKRSFRFFATWVAVTGLLMGAAFGAGMARGKADAPSQNGTGLTAQQVQQLLGGASGGGASTGQPGGAIFIGPGPAGGAGGGGGGGGG